jgi:hypothetical protein
MKVICIDADFESPYKGQIPKEGEVYTVLEHKECGCGCGGSGYYFTEISGLWDADGFIPLSDDNEALTSVEEILEYCETAPEWHRDAH